MRFENLERVIAMGILAIAAMSAVSAVLIWEAIKWLYHNINITWS